MEKQSITKKQHYVPQMYLKRFAVEGRCFVYNPHNKKIYKTPICDICRENLLYEIRNDKGEYLNPDSKNIIENAFSKIEYHANELLDNVIKKVEEKDRYVILTNEEREGLIGFSLFMLLRNPLVRDVLPEVLKISTGIEIKAREEKSIAWLFTIVNMEKICPSLLNSKIRFLKSHRDKIFITSSVPLSFSGDPIQRDFYLPISTNISIELSLPDNILENINKCGIDNLDSQQTDLYNCKLLSRDNFIISPEEIILEKYIQFMDEFDATNPYTKANLDYLEKMPPEFFVIIVNWLLEEEIKYKNKYILPTYNRLIKNGFTKEDAILKMAYSCSDEVKRYFICNKLPEWELVSKRFKSM